MRLYDSGTGVRTFRVHSGEKKISNQKCLVITLISAVHNRNTKNN
jgi:hypothetical protein